MIVCNILKIEVPSYANGGEAAYLCTLQTTPPLNLEVVISGRVVKVYSEGIRLGSGAFNLSEGSIYNFRSVGIAGASKEYVVKMLKQACLHAILHYLGEKDEQD